MNNEIWRSIPEYEGLYSVSNIGRVKRQFKNGNINILHNNNNNGYLSVTLTKQGESRCFKIHRLVALCFLPNPLNKSDVDHIDLNKHNNNLNNLRWATRSENNKNKKGYSKIGKKFIYSNRNSFLVRFKNITTTKTFKTIEEALEYRNTKIIEYNITFFNHYDN